MERQNWIEYREEKFGNKYKNTRSWKIDTTGDFSGIVDPYLWKPLMEDVDDA